MSVQTKTLAKLACSLAVSAMVLASCLPEPLEVRGIPTVKPEIVVSTQMVPDQSLLVLLTKSFGALDASVDSDPEQVLEQIAIEDATVTVTSPTGTYTLLPLGRGFYGGTFIPLETGIDYTLNVESETLGTVEATTQVKPQVTFDQIEAELYFDGFDDSLAQITYNFKDPEEKNYYVLNVLKLDSADIAENLLNPRDYSRLLDDAEFNGRQYQETFRVFPREFDRGDRIAVYLSNVSSEYYTFLKLRIDNRYSFTEFISEPINYPTNVVGGKGYFNLYIPDIRFFQLEARD
jgi:hypothetical protein